MLEVHGKIFEKIINERLVTKWTAEGFFHENQYGFRPGRGTTQAIALAYEKISQSLSMGSRCTIVLRDVSAAFDRVWRDGLNYKILHTGLALPVEKLLANFTANRTAIV